MQATPRWEYRCWTSQAQARSLFAGDWQAAPAEQRQDIYLIGPDPAFMPKLRDGRRFEIKRLLGCRQRLEYWALFMSLSLPHRPGRSPQLAAAGMEIFGDAAQPADYLRIAAAAESWFAMPVEKSRRLFSLQGLRCEVTRVLCANREYWTFAAEAADHAPLAQLVAELPLAGLPNRNYRNFLAEQDFASP